MDSEMLGRVISTARKQKNLSQKELGDLLNVSNKAVSKWENGEATPRSETLIKLCDILELNKTEILGFEQKYDSKEIDSLKSENSKLKNQIESINKKQKKALKYIFVVAICFVIFVVAVSFLHVLVFLFAQSCVYHAHTISVFFTNSPVVPVSLLFYDKYCVFSGHFKIWHNYSIMEYCIHSYNSFVPSMISGGSSARATSFNSSDSMSVLRRWA